MKKPTIITAILLTANLLMAQYNTIDTSFYSEALHETKMVDIYFPPGYDENPDLYYPVIYYLHYWFGDQNTMVSEMMSTTQTLINNGTIEPVIMVGADNSPDYPFNGSMYTNSILWGNYEDYMVEDLVNWVESSFRAVPSRNYRALLGHSMGGYGCWRYGTSHKDKFKVLAATAAPVLNLTDSTFSWSRTKILQQCTQNEPPYFYDYNNGSTTMGMFLFCGAFCPNLNTPQTYINPAIVEFTLNDNGNYIDTIVDKLKANSIDHLIHLVEPSDSLGILFGCGAADLSYIENHLAFKDSLDMLDIPYEYYSHNGGHIMPAGFKQRALIFIDSLLMPPIIPSNSCLPQGITFTTQEEIDNFQINHPFCSEIEGDVSINGDDILNLYGLNVITQIEGSLTIGLNTILSLPLNHSITNLNGLENLQSIGSDLVIGNNASLTDLSGLDNLQLISGDLIVFSNDTLSSLSGLNSLTSIEGSLKIGTWGAIWEACAFGNRNLLNIEDLENLQTIGANLWLLGNISLQNLTGLDNLSSIEGDLWILENDSLTTLNGLENLTALGGSLLTGNGSIWGEHGNLSLISLSGLENLATVGGSFDLSYNYVLSDLNALEQLISIGGDLFVYHNNMLNSLNGIQNIESGSIENLLIAYNEVLSTCHVQSICVYLANPNGTIEIYLNAPGCNSPEEVLNICIQGLEKEETLKGANFNIYPSPVNDFATLQFQSDQACNGLIEIFNTTGVCVQSRKLKMDKAGQQHLVLDFTAMPIGVYFCRVQIRNEIVTHKIIKQ